MLEQGELLLASLHNQYLLEKAPAKTVVSDLCGLQAQFANNPKYALRIRAEDFDEHGWNSNLVKTWTFRGTLHAVLRDELGVFLAARGVPDDWQNGWGMSGSYMEYWSKFLLEHISGGVCEREALKSKCREKGMAQEDIEKVFHGWGGLIYEMCRRGLIAHDCVTAKRFVLCGNARLMETDDARAALIRRYFRSFGPATIEDCTYFTACKKREILRIIEKYGIALKSVRCGETEYFYIGELHTDGKIPACLFLTGFDQLLMGYKNRARMMDEKFKSDVTTNTGIVHPTILLNGRIQAKWKKDGAKLIITPFKKISKKNLGLMASRGKRIFDGEVREVCFNEWRKSGLT